MTHSIQVALMLLVVSHCSFCGCGKSENKAQPPTTTATAAADKKTSAPQAATSVETNGDQTINVWLRDPDNNKAAKRDDIKADTTFHSVLTVLDQDYPLVSGEAGSIVKVKGKAGYGMTFGPGGGKLESVAGLPGTTLDISAITGEFVYAGARWKPTGKGKATIVCVKEGIVAENVDNLGPVRVAKATTAP